MSKNNNVNPDHYKTAGREPQGQAVAHEVERQSFAKEKAHEKQEPHREASRKAKQSGDPVPGIVPGPPQEVVR